jgi:acetyl-CoA carboxylase biotin carboxyl carrier protein
MDLQKIKALIDLLAQSPLSKLEVIEGEERVKLVKAKRGGGRAEGQAGGERVVVPETTAAAPDAPSLDDAPHIVDAARNVSAENNAAADTPRIVRAPTFGIVHLTPSPGDAPFVRVGDAVEEGRVLCTIEAMKMFNAIECDGGGTLLEILVEPGSEVESGQPLFRIG